MTPKTKQPVRAAAGGRPKDEAAPEPRELVKLPSGQAVTPWAEQQLRELFDLAPSEAVFICSKAVTLEDMFRELHKLGPEGVAEGKERIANVSRRRDERAEQPPEARGDSDLDGPGGADPAADGRPDDEPERGDAARDASGERGRGEPATGGDQQRIGDW